MISSKSIKVLLCINLVAGHRVRAPDRPRYVGERVAVTGARGVAAVPARLLLSVVVSLPLAAESFRLADDMSSDWP